MKIKIAELNIDILSRGRYIEKLCKKYICDFDLADICIDINKNDIMAELDAVEHQFSAEYCESIAAYRKIGYRLPEFNAFVLHGATFKYKDRGIALLAASGTGKSSHMKNWISLYGDEVQVINGDKPIIRIKDGTPYAYGTPWCGKEGMSTNTSVRLTDICFITRAKENSTVLLGGKNITARLLNQVIIPKGSSNIVKTLDLIDQMAKNCRVWEIKCTADISSAKVSSKAILEV